MYSNTCDLSNKVHEDFLSKFFSSMEFDVNGFGSWRQTNINSITNCINPEYKIMYVISGTCNFNCENTEYTVSKGDAVFLEPLNVYSAKCTSDELFSYVFIHFNLNHYILRRQFESIILGDLGPVFKSKQIASLSYMFNSLMNDPINDGKSLTLKITLLRTFLCFAINRKSSISECKIPLEFTSETQIIKEAIDYVMNNLDSRIDVKAVAKSLNISENKLYRNFIDFTNTSPSKYFMQLKIQKAEELLKKTDKTIEEISFELGFSSPFHFSKSFKSSVGINPSDVRKEIVLNK